MTVYTVRREPGQLPLSTHPEVDDAITAAQSEALAFDLHPDPALGRRLDLVITADPHPDTAGEPVAWFTTVHPASRGC